MSKYNRFYRSWEIDYSASRPVTGTFTATRFGVELCASSRVAIERVVDDHIRRNASSLILTPAPEKQ